MSEHVVRFATESDLAPVFEMSRAYTDTSGGESGFLVSQFSIEQYRRFHELSRPADDKGTVVFLVCVDAETDKPVGFLVGYHCDYIKRAGDFDPLSTERRILMRFGDQPGFYVIKQVGVGAGMVGKGVGRMLYEAFFRLLSVVSAEAHLRDSGATGLQAGIPPVDVFAAVVGHPPNTRSARFHEKMGFLPVFGYGKAPHQEQTQTNVWHTTAQASLLHQLVGTDPKARTEALRASLESARGVYTHEDNLNWTKLSFTTNYFVAIIAAQFILPTVIPAMSEPFRASLVMLAQTALSILGIYLIIAFEQKISSGLNFMFAYKRAILVAESKLLALSPAFHPSIANVPLRSRTITLIGFMRRVFGGLLGITIGLNLAIYIASLL